MRFVENIHAVFNNKTLRKIMLRLRLPLGLAAAAYVVLTLDPAWFTAGLAVSAFGAVFQWWCFGCIMTSKTLATRGPYLLMRNPMYIARMFLVLGVVLMTGNLYLLAVMTALYILYMINRVRREEEKLKPIFGEDYARYLREIPRFVPSFKRFNAREFLFFDPVCFHRNNGLPNVAVVAIAYAFLIWMRCRIP